MSASQISNAPKSLKKPLLWLSLLGAGLVVMLADTDAGSLITAAQSGAIWGYKLLALQFILMPILYIAQELTVRLGLATGMGHGELIKHYFGKTWAWLSVSTLVVSCIGASIPCNKSAMRLRLV
jgi:Mn2+/Fe2+ NRAMP family transporter